MKKQHRIRAWLIAAGIVAVVVAGAACGGSRASKPSSGPPGGADASTGGSASNDAFKSTTLGAPQDYAAAPDAQAAAGGVVEGESGRQDGGAALPSLLDRKIIMVATINLNVEDVAGSFEDVSNIATGAGGFVASSSFGHNGDEETASVTIRVPSDRFQDALGRLRKLGDVGDEDSRSDDVTEQYTDLQSRLRNLKATEDQYIALLGKAKDIGEVLQVQDRLNAVRAEIEQVQGRVNLVDHQTDLATITVHLDPPLVEQAKPATGGNRGPLEVAADAFEASLDVLLGIATGVLAVAAFSWWLVPLAVLGWILGRRQLRARAP